MIKPPPLETKEWSKTRAKTLAEDLDILLGDLCIIWGFCGGLTGWELTHDDNVITAEAFAHAVLDSEDLDSAAAVGWLPKISGVFVERYGPSASPRDFG